MNLGRYCTFVMLIVKSTCRLNFTPSMTELELLLRVENWFPLSKFVMRGRRALYSMYSHFQALMTQVPISFRSTHNPS